MMVGPRGLALIQAFEDLRLEAYQDSAGVWTIGWGHTGADVHKGLEITNERADQLLRQDVEWARSGVAGAISSRTTQSQFDAMVSLAYNIGVSGFCSSTVIKRHNDGDYYKVPEAFTWWIKSGGMKLRGLLRRRCQEAALYCEDRW